MEGKAHRKRACETEVVSPFRVHPSILPGPRHMAVDGEILAGDAQTAPALKYLSAP